MSKNLLQRFKKTIPIKAPPAALTSCAVRVATRYAPTPLVPVGAPAAAPRALPNRRNVAVDSHAQYVLTVTTAPA